MENFEKWPRYEQWPEGLEEEKPKGRRVGFRIAQVLAGLVVIGGLCYLSGPYQYFFFHKTPPSVSQEKLQKEIDAERITLPLNVYIFRNNEENGSERSKESVLKLVENASNIWEQAAINFKVKEIHILYQTDQQIDTFLDTPSLFLKDLDQFNAQTINLFLVKKLRGINGLSFPGLRTAVVADYTTEHDFRVLGHELGHLLGLGYVDTKSSLMSQGANGTTLSSEEIIQAREKAKIIKNKINLKNENLYLRNIKSTFRKVFRNS